MAVGGGLVGHVERERHRLGESGGCGRGAVTVEVGADHGVAACGKSPGGCRSDPAGGAGHK